MLAPRPYFDAMVFGVMKMKRSIRTHGKKNLGITPLVTGLAVLLCMRCIFFVGYVPSSSMEPAIARGSCILGIRLLGNLHAGDIVVFEKDGEHHVKRIAGIPGQTVYINDVSHDVSVDVLPSKYTRALKIPQQCYFVLGDNQGNSMDSRYWDEPFISKEQLKAYIPWNTD